MLKNLKKQQQGFTIIEVMIVLVIAAVILLIVFLAVPALQRNSRNTQRKSDASRAATAVIEYKTNHAGAWPATSAELTDLTGKLAYYQASEVTVGVGTPVVAVYSDLSTWGDGGYTPLTLLFVLTDTKCTDGKTITNANGSAAVVYAVEQGNGSRKAACA